MRQSACDRSGGSGVRLYDDPDIKLFILFGWGRSFLYVAWPTGVNSCFTFAPGFSELFGAKGSPSSGSLLNLLSSFFFLIHQGGYHDLFVCP